jgi:F0F1-type ATP synthase membrane subunit b/b'
MSNLDQQLEDVVQRRKKVADSISRLQGRKEQAEANLAAVEEECREKKIDPDKIDDIIEKLETKFRGIVEELTKDTEEAERKIAPFVTGTGNNQ